MNRPTRRQGTGIDALVRLGVAELRAHKARLLATALGVVLTVAFATSTYVVTATSHQALASTAQRRYVSTDLVVRSPSAITATFFTQRQPIASSWVDAARAVDGVAAALPQWESSAQVLDRAGRPVGGNGRPTLATNWLGDDELNPFELTDGRAPTAPNEIVLDLATARLIDASVGDTVPLLMSTGPTKPRLVGIARLGSSSGAAGATVVQFSNAALRKLDGRANDVDAVLIRVRPDQDVSKVAASLRKLLPRDGSVQVADRHQLETEAAGAPDLGSRYLRVVLLALTALASLVSLFVIANTFGVVVGQRTRELALLRTVGATRRQVGALVLVEACGIGVLASALGVVGGVGLAKAVASLLVRAGVNVPTGPLTVPLHALVLPFLLGLVACVIGALRPAWRASRVAPLQSMSERSIDIERLRRRGVIGGWVIVAGVVGVTWSALGSSLPGLGIAGTILLIGTFAAAPWSVWWLGRAFEGFAARRMGAPGSLAAGNFARSPARTSSSAIALGLGVMLVVTVLVLGASASASLDASIERQFRGDFVLQNRNLTGGEIPVDVAGRLRRDKSVRAVSEIRLLPAEVDGTAGVIAAVDGERLAELMDLQLVAGRIDTLDRSTIALSTQAAGELHAGVGDRVAVRFARTGTSSLTVSGLYRDDALVGRYLVDLSTYNANVSRPVDTLVLVSMVPGPSVNDRKQSIQRAILPYYPAVAVLDVGRYRAAVARQIKQGLGLVTVLLALAMVVALAGVANTFVLSVFERRKEIGLLRAVGMTRAQSRSAVLIETLAVTSLGTAVGVLLAIVFARATAFALRADGLEQFRVPIRPILGIVAASLIAGAGAAAIPARRIGKLGILETIDGR